MHAVAISGSICIGTITTLMGNNDMWPNRARELPIIVPHKTSKNSYCEWQKERFNYQFRFRHAIFLLVYSMKMTCKLLQQVSETFPFIVHSHHLPKEVQKSDFFSPSSSSGSLLRNCHIPRWFIMQPDEHRSGRR
ncbi:hypothetical protein NPIL_472301 [Nephila pilipes]|uniref:Uncharacterized protein n=1 Tax=Nephila pilipes TaxID=299642 RepID=A0A8X6T2R5_NEPPI|nr:hypothetical protein NPIL_472301 [Nephila pilipes]